MNNSKSRAKDTKCYQHLKVVDDMKDSGLLAQGSRCYEELKAMNDMNDSRS